LKSLIESAPKTIPHVNQLNLNFLETHAETVELATKNNITLQSKSPLGYGHDDSQELTIISDIPVIKKIAKHHKVTAYQVAMKWILQHGWLLSYQSGSPSVELELSDADMSGFTMTDEEMKELDAFDGLESGSAFELPSGNDKLQIETKEITSGVNMPVISIGCDGLDEDQVEHSVKHWLELGGRGIDTSYKDGRPKMVKEAITKSKVDRKDIFLTSKIPSCNHKLVAKRVQIVLKQLGTDHVDLLLIHHPTGGNCTLAWAEMEKVFDSKLVRAIGVSNFNKRKLNLLKESAKIVPHLLQLKFNVFETHQNEVKHATDLGITVQSIAPLGSEETQDLTIVSENPLIKKIADDHQVTPYQVAMKWIIQNGWVLSFEATALEVEAFDADVTGFKLNNNEMQKLGRLHQSDSKNSVARSSSIKSSSDSSHVGIFAGVGIALTLFLSAALIIKRRSSSKRLHSSSHQKETEVVNVGDGLYKDQPEGYKDEIIAAEEGVGYEGEEELPEDAKFM